MLPEETYNKYVQEWSIRFNISPPDAWKVIECLVNAKKNYASAVAMMFQLGWFDYRDYLLPASKSLREYCEKYKGTAINAADLYNWMNWYIGEFPLPTA